MHMLIINTIKVYLFVILAILIQVAQTYSYGYIGVHGLQGGFSGAVPSNSSVEISMYTAEDIDQKYCFLPNCLTCQNAYKCLICQVQKECCQLSCSVCAFQNQCLACFKGWVYNSSLGICQLEESCLEYACIGCKEDICVDCLEGFVNNQYTYQCVRCPLECSLCDIYGNCLGCSSQYYLTEQDQCQYCGVPNCYLCQSELTCRTCRFGYTISTTFPICVPCPLHCQYCAAASICSVCKPGYYITTISQTSVKCKPCASSCTSCYGTPSNCTLCNTDSYLSPGQQQGSNNTCIRCYYGIPFCLACLLSSNNNNNTLICLNCKSGMYVLNNTCQLCPVGCSSCTQKACISCSSAYYLQNGTCLSCNIKGCTSCMNNTLCTSCNVGQYVGTDNIICLKCQANCQDCIDNETCLNCYNGYVEINELCMPCKPNCISCSTYLGHCGQCVAGFYVVVNKQSSDCFPCPIYCVYCLNQYICEFCSPGFYLVNGSSCVACIVENCYQCNNSHNIYACTLCNNGYYLLQEQINGSSFCIECQPNCQVCDNVSCYLCTQGYYLQQSSSMNINICMECVQNCQVCENALECLQCQKGFYLNYNSSLCLPCYQGCEECISVIGCGRCKLGYYLNETLYNYEGRSVKICVKCVEPCQMCSSAEVCESCLPEYTFIDPGVCVPCPQNCILCDGRLDCLECIQGYTISIDIKSQHIIGERCPIGCSQCLQTNRFSPSNISVLKCLQCQTGSILLQSGVCFTCGSTLQTQGCQECNIQGQCIKCYTGFMLTNISNTTTAAQCINNNYQSSSLWPLIGTLIGLGCLFMVLLLVYFYLKVNSQEYKMRKIEKRRESLSNTGRVDIQLTQPHI